MLSRPAQHPSSGELAPGSPVSAEPARGSASRPMHGEDRTDLAPEWRLVERCAVPGGEPSLQAEREALARTLGPDAWDRARQRARAEGVAPLMFAALAGDGLLPLVPTPVAEGLREDYCATLVRNRRIQTVQTQLLRALAARRVPVMALKGLALALRHYGALALRPTTDIDLLVPRERVGEVCAVLVEMGYRPSSGSGKPSGYNAMTHSVVDYLRADGPQIEIHWELFNYAPYRAGLPAAAAWERAERTTLFDQPVAYLAPADELRYLSVHYAAEHHLARLIWGVDLVRLVRGLPESWDWDGFVRETIGARLALPVAMALADCRERLALQLPAGVLETLLEAGESAAERDEWEASQSPAFTAGWVRAQARELRGPLEWAIFLRGLLLPRAPALAQLYGEPSTRWPPRGKTYLRHLLRMARLIST